MNYYNEIKNEIINNEVTKRIKDYSKNKSDLESKYRIGKLLSEAGKHYGEGIIKEYSKKLTNEFGSGYSKRNLWLMLRFYEEIKKMQTLSAQLTWSHYVEVLSLHDINEKRYYIKLIEKQHLTVRDLRDRIKNKEYERLPKETKLKLINKDNKKEIIDEIKNPIIIKNYNKYEEVSEKILQQLILEDIENFMKELGNSFCFIGSEYKIKFDNTYNYIDLLLFNYEYNCFVVIELKVTDLKKEHIGQIGVYMNYIDENLRKLSQNKTIGIIICREDNEYVIKYCSDDKIISREYKLV